MQCALFNIIRVHIWPDFPTTSSCKEPVSVPQAQVDNIRASTPPERCFILIWHHPCLRGSFVINTCQPNSTFPNQLSPAFERSDETSGLVAFAIELLNRSEFNYQSKGLSKNLHYQGMTNMTAIWHDSNTYLYSTEKNKIRGLVSPCKT